MSTVENARAIRARLGVLLGTLARGNLLVRSLGPAGLVPAYSFATPIVGGELEPEGLVFVRPNPNTPDGAWPVTSTGELVEVEAVQGGIIGNTDEGTPYLWGPRLRDIEEVSEAAAGGVDGGEDSQEEGAPRQLVSYKQLTMAEAEELFRAKTSRYPAMVLSWERTAPLDGPMSMKPGARPGRTRQGTKQYRHVWNLFLIVDRTDSEAARREELDVLRDEVVEWLSDAISARGLRLSNSPGAEVLDASVLRAYPTSYVDVVRFETRFTLRRKDTSIYTPWLNTHLRQDSDVAEGQPELHVPDIEVPMVPDDGNLE